MTPQNWNAEQYKNNASFVSQLGSPIIELLAPQPKEKILDLGCGEGTLSWQIKNYQCDILAIDSSADMIAKAKKKGLNAIVLAAEDLDYSQQFDAVFSNAVLHWVSDINLVVDNVYNCLKDRGRFVGEFGGEGNIKAITDAISQTFADLPHFGNFDNTWYFPSIEQYQKVLQQVGFEVEFITLNSRPTFLKSGIESWLKIFANGIINHLSIEEQNLFISEVIKRLKPLIFSQDDGWVADYVRLRFKAIKI